jgi:hypothetical protein
MMFGVFALAFLAAIGAPQPLFMTVVATAIWGLGMWAWPRRTGRL